MGYDMYGNYTEDNPYADFGMPGSTVKEVQPTAAPNTATYGQFDQNGADAGFNLGDISISDADAAAREAQAQQYYQMLQEQAGGQLDVSGYLADLQRNAFYDTNNVAGAYSSLSSQINDRLASGGGDDSGGTSGTSGGWFGANAPGGTGSGFPQISPFGSQYSTLERPSWLQGPYTPPTWGGLSLAELQATPGYQARLDAGLQSRERSAAAQGSILSGGTQKGLERYGQDFAANEYANEYARRYGAFIDSANLGQQGRLINENAYQSDVGNNFNQYKSRYQQYLDLISNQRNADSDLWGRLQDTTQNSLQAAALARP